MAIKELTDSETNLLEELDKRLHYTQETSSKICGRTISGIYHGYYDNERGKDERHERLTKRQLEIISKMIQKKSDVIFQPIQDSFGFHPCFMVSKIEAPTSGTIETTPLLRFSINQLPETLGEDYIIRLYSSEENSRKCEFAGVTFNPDLSSYEY